MRNATGHNNYTTTDVTTAALHKIQQLLNFFPYIGGLPKNGPSALDLWGLRLWKFLS